MRIDQREFRGRFGPRAALIACVALGVALRVWRYALNSPLWWNEAFLTVNFLKRGYAELLQPLDYNQVCPPGFLWTELAITRLLGISEMSLRLFPLVCGVAAMFLMARVSTRILTGWSAVVPVALLSIAYHPIRLSAEVKPYATDLVAALVVFDLALGSIAALNGQGGTDTKKPLLLLAVATPFLLFFSYPALLVVAGAVVVLAPSVWRRGPSGGRWAHAVWCLSSVASFLAIRALCADAQTHAASLNHMSEYWSAGFPSVFSLNGVAHWLAQASVGEAFSFPVGDGGLLSLATLALATVGCAALWRRSQRLIAILLIAPPVTALLAAIAGKYPIGVHARLGQHLVPSLAISMSIGLAWLGQRVSHALPGWRSRFLRLAAASVVLIGVIPLVRDTARPHKTSVEKGARDFARVFWPNLSNARLECSRWDLNLAPWVSTNPDVALYLCNQAIYSPARRRSRTHAPRLQGQRLVHFWSTSVEPATIESSLVHRPGVISHEIWAVPGHRTRDGRIDVFQFASSWKSAASPHDSLQSRVPRVVRAEQDRWVTQRRSDSSHASQLDRKPR